jgi:hypothetical protein
MNRLGNRLCEALVRTLDFLVLKAVEWRLRRKYDRLYRAFENHYGYVPRISAPENTSELIQWRKIFDHNPLFVTFSDKLETKKWAAAKDPRVKTAPVLWSGTDPGELPIGIAGAGVVIKTNHASGYNCFPDEDGSFDLSEVATRLRSWMETDYSEFNDEWAYSRVPRCCFVEALVGPREDIVELEFRCHDGSCSSATLLIYEKTPSKERADLYPDGTRIRSDQNSLPLSFPLPEKFFEVRSVAEKLSEGIDFVRIDFLLSGGDFFLCEITVYPRAGLGVEDEVADLIFAAWVRSIDRSWFFSAKPHSFLFSLYREAVGRHFERMTIGAGQKRPAKVTQASA